MTLRLTRAEGEWLRRILCSAMVDAADRLRYARVCSVDFRVRTEYDRDVATGLVGAIDAAMARKGGR